MAETQRIAVVGFGMIGSGLAANALMHGCDVSVYDLLACQRGSFDGLRERMRSIFQVFIDNGVCSPDEAEEYIARLHFSDQLADAVRGAALVQECVPERLEDKHAVYRQIQEVCGDSAIIASSTSGLFPSDLAEGALCPGNIIVAHPFNPSYLLPLVELCGGKYTAPGIIDRAKAIYESWGKVCVVCQKEVKGFVANRINWACMDVCKEQIWGGVCSAEDMDKAIMFGPGLRMAMIGQTLATSLGVEGGFSKFNEKYGHPHDPRFDILAAGVDEILQHHTEEQGRDPDSANAYLNRLLIEVLRLKHLM